ncbi:MAG: hypothetical protein KDB03_18605 [Planctomycetales bacterium]|nr:hypothetical protein [Planctomycetales bacterium]
MPVIAAIVISAGKESMWVDELHSSWVVKSAYSEVVERSLQGNQVPLYFYFLKPLVSTVSLVGWADGHSGDFWLRLPSLVAWVISVGVAARWIAHQQSQINPKLTGWAALAVMLLAGWDRINWFYASEARVYAILCAVTLVAWWQIASLWLSCQSPESLGTELGQASNPKTQDSWSGKYHVTTWTLLAALQLGLQPVSILTVVWQWLLLTWICWRAALVGHKCWRAWCVASCILFLIGLYLFVLFQPTWINRSLWASFAGSSDYKTAIGLFPFLPLLFPALVAQPIDQAILFGRQKRTVHQPSTLRTANSTISVGLLIASLAPIATAWMLTYCEIAPIFHRRYVCFCGLPLALLSAWLLSNLKHTSLRWLGLGCSLLWLLYSQGELGLLAKGQIVGVQRNENWKQAVAMISSQANSHDQVWCASNLIEGTDVTYPLIDSDDDYLSFPLRGNYQVIAERSKLIPHALAGDNRTWGQLLGNHFLGQSASPQIAWIVYRGSPENLKNRLRGTARWLNQKELLLESDDVILSFGAICVTKIRLIDPSSKPTSGL